MVPFVVRTSDGRTIQVNAPTQQMAQQMAETWARQNPVGHVDPSTLRRPFGPPPDAPRRRPQLGNVPNPAPEVGDYEAGSWRWTSPQALNFDRATTRGRADIDRRVGDFSQVMDNVGGLLKPIGGGWLQRGAKAVGGLAEADAQAADKRAQVLTKRLGDYDDDYVW